MPNLTPLWTIVLWIVLAILAVFLFQSIVLPLVHAIT